MVIEISGGLGLLVASGYKAGIVRQILPEESLAAPARAIARSWLIDSWSVWVGHGNVEDVWISDNNKGPESLPR